MYFGWTSNPFLEIWAETSTRLVENAIAANEATVSAWDLSGTDDTAETHSEPTPLERIEPAGDLPDWHAETSANDRDELRVGDRFEFSKTITEPDVRRFAVASGDTNPLHLDEEYAAQTRFEGRIVHGTLVGGLISAALARIPGLVIYLSQEFEFHNPVRIDDRVTAECEIVEALGNDQYRLRTQVLDDDKTVIDGEAVILVEDEPTA